MTNNKGITLIALVITIIVLLILAGVSIAMLTGQNGILTRATDASVANDKAEVMEKVNMELNAQMTNAMAGIKFDDADEVKANMGTLPTGYSVNVEPTTSTAYSETTTFKITVTAPTDVPSNLWTNKVGTVSYSSNSWSIDEVE